VYKVETIGDAYMIVAGHQGEPDHAARMVNMAVDMLIMVEEMRFQALGPAAASTAGEVGHLIMRHNRHRGAHTTRKWGGHGAGEPSTQVPAQQTRLHVPVRHGSAVYPNHPCVWFYSVFGAVEHRLCACEHSLDARPHSLPPTTPHMDDAHAPAGGVVRHGSRNDPGWDLRIRIGIHTGESPGDGAGVRDGRLVEGRGGFLVGQLPGSHCCFVWCCRWWWWWWWRLVGQLPGSHCCVV
jgi:hypothetical protein